MTSKHTVFAVCLLGMLWLPSTTVLAQTTQPATKPTTQSVTKPTTQPATKPAIRAAVQPTSRPAVPTAKPGTQPASRRVVRVRPVVRRVVLEPVKIPQPTRPFRTGWLSFALTGDDQIWLDGRKLGAGALAYLRVLAGRHHLRLKHAKYRETTLYVQVWPGRHVAVLRRGARVGLRRYRWERSNAQVRIYSAQGKPRQRSVAPGTFCVKPPSVCHVLMPGDHLYLQPDGRSLILPSQKALRSAQSYLPRPGDGFLTLYSYPPGALFLNNRLVAMTPVARLPLKPGKYKAWVRNGYLNMEWHGWIVIKEGKEVRKVAMTTPPKGANLVITSKQPARITVNGLFRGWTPAHVLPVAPGKYTVRLQRINGKSWQQTVEVMPGQLEIIRWKE